MNKPRFIKLEPYSEEEWLEVLSDPDFAGSWLEGRYLEGIKEAKGMSREKLEMNYARMKYRSESYADIIEELDDYLGESEHMWTQENMRFLDKLMKAYKQRRSGAEARHASTNVTKELMRQAWLLMRENYRQPNGKPDKLGFAGDMYNCFGIPKDVKNIYPWIKKWESENQ